jgi:hypothetical protein
VALTGNERKKYTVLVGKPEGKSPLVRSWCRWQDGIRMELREIGWGMWSGFIWLRAGIGSRIL